MTMLTIGLGKAGTIEVDTSRFNEQVQEYIFNYGLKQMLNDVHAGEKDLALKPALSAKKLQSLYDGNVAQIRSNGDAVARVMRELAEADVKRRLPASIKWSKLDRKVQQQVIDKQVAANEASYRAAAEARLAIQPESAETPDDIMALLTA